jgi:hypothetical protein
LIYLYGAHSFQQHGFGLVGGAELLLLRETNTRDRRSLPIARTSLKA